MQFNPGFGIIPESDPLGFRFEDGVYEPLVEIRKLDAIRKSLMDPNCEGPEDVYAIAMDTGLAYDRPGLIARNLLFGVVTYAKGSLGNEPIRSQGHIHAISPSCGASTCELYEIWDGEACIYMQESACDDPGKCYAVFAGPGDVVLVPPGWAHMTISTNKEKQMTFGAWCVRDYGFEYTDVRSHKGLSWFPCYDGSALTFRHNDNYIHSDLICKSPRVYKEFGIETNKPIYLQYQENPNRFLFISKPDTAVDSDNQSLWNHFIP